MQERGDLDKRRREVVKLDEVRDVALVGVDLGLEATGEGLAPARHAVAARRVDLEPTDRAQARDLVRLDKLARRRVVVELLGSVELACGTGEPRGAKAGAVGSNEGLGVGGLLLRELGRRVRDECN